MSSPDDIETDLLIAVVVVPALEEGFDVKISDGDADRIEAIRVIVGYIEDHAAA